MRSLVTSEEDVEMRGFYAFALPTAIGVGKPRRRSGGQQAD